MNFICWNEELNAKNIFPVKGAFKDAAGCHKKTTQPRDWVARIAFPTPQNAQIHTVLVTVLK